MLLISSDAQVAAAVETAAHRACGKPATVMRTADLDGARRVARRARFDLVVLSMEDQDVADAVPALGELVGTTPIVAIGPRGSGDAARRAVAAGARDYLTIADLETNALARVLRAIGTPGLDSRPGAGLRAERYGKTIGVVGATGGVGTTTLVLNLAICMASQHRSVIAAELQPWLGAFASQLRLTPKSTLADVLASPARIESDLDRNLTPMPPGLHLLLGPSGPLPRRLFEEELLDRLLHALADRAEYVFVDLPACLPESFKRFVRHLDHVAVVVEPHEGCVRAGGELIDRLRGWGIGPTRLSVIGVHKGPPEGPARDRVAKLCAARGITFTGEVPPAAEACGQANQRGVPVIMSAVDHPASVAIVAAAKELLAEVDHFRLRVGLVARSDEVARRLRGLLDDADAIRFDVVRVQDVDDVLTDLVDGSFDAVLLVHEDPLTPLDQLLGRTVAMADHTAIIVIGIGDVPGADASGLAQGAQDRLDLERVDGYWLSHAIRHAIERRRVQARLEREVQDLIACEADLRRLVIQLLRESHHDPRMV